MPSSEITGLRTHTSGIASGIGGNVSIGDVVLADTVICCDARCETSEGPRFRRTSHSASSWIGHRLNDFFDSGPQARDPFTGETIALRRGPVGSGKAVITTDSGSAIRTHLHTVHEKVLAVEIEAAGLVRSVVEEADRERLPGGWSTVRGISDLAAVPRAAAHLCRPACWTSRPSVTGTAADLPVRGVCSL